MASATAYSGSVPFHYETYLGPLFFEPYAVDLVGRIHGHPRQVLELACGTGRVTRQLLNKLLPAARLVATDLNPDMLAIARQAVGAERVEWQVADAQNLSFDNECSDLVACQYGVMFFPDKPKAFAETFRVLKKGGVYLFNTWDHLRHNALSGLAQEVLEELFPADPPPFLAKGPYSYFDRDQIEKQLREAGFADIRIDAVALNGIAASAEDAVNGMVDGTPINLYLAERNASNETIKAALKKVLVQRYGQQNLSLPMRAFVCSATKP